MKKLLIITIVFLSICMSSAVYAQEGPQNEITPEVSPPTRINCPDTQKDCYVLLEPIGNLESVDISADAGEDQGIGGFINFMFEIGIGVAGVMGVVMLVIYGFQYAANDKNIATFEVLKGKITNVILGLLLLLGTFIILNTINPDLLIVSPEIGMVEFNIANKSLSNEQIDYIDTIDVSQIKLEGSAFSDTAFLGYLAHQQGVGGAASILWAARNNYPSVPTRTPFIRNASRINSNMRGNVGRDFSKVTGTTTVRPVSFVNYWAKKVIAAKQSSITLSLEVSNALQSTASSSGIPFETLKALCKIESNCNPSATNGSYRGLFQMGTNEFNKFGGKGDIFNPLQNALSAANYMKYNLKELEKYWKKING